MCQLRGAQARREKADAREENFPLVVPWEAGADAIVTASMSLSPKDGGKKAPAAVVGFQMPMTGFYRRFIALTSRTTNPLMNCSLNWIDCYLLDQNGYVVISEAHNDTGQFMGTQEGAVMKSMVGQGLYNPFEIYDYQAWCWQVVSINARRVESKAPQRKKITRTEDAKR